MASSAWAFLNILICCSLHVREGFVAVHSGEQQSRAARSDGPSRVAGRLRVRGEERAVCLRLQRLSLQLWQSGPPGSGHALHLLWSCHCWGGSTHWYDPLFLNVGWRVWRKKMSRLCLSLFNWYSPLNHFFKHPNSKYLSVSLRRNSNYSVLKAQLTGMQECAGGWGFPGWKVNPCWAFILNVNWISSVEALQSSQRHPF